MINTKINHTIVKDISFSLLEEGISIKLRADGYSMYPVIRPGSFIYIEPLKDDHFPCPGEIVAWKRDSGFVVHRLVRILRKDNRTMFITRGDSCLREDPPVEAIAGKVVRIEDDKGTIAECIGLEPAPRYNINRLRALGYIALKKIFSLN